ncbi:hypothetical protein GCM10027037_03280 [Mucilaginibacter koreensis]
MKKSFLWSIYSAEDPLPAGYNYFLTPIPLQATAVMYYLFLYVCALKFKQTLSHEENSTFFW